MTPIRWTFHDCDELIKAEVEAYWNKKAPRLERLLKTFPEGLRDLSVSVYHNRPRAVFDGRAVLELPSRTLAAGASEKDLRALVDRLADVLATEIKRHRSRLRHDWVYRRKSRRRDELTAAGPMLEQDRRERRREAFFELLMPILRPLKEHARREVRLLEKQGTIGRGEVTAADILSEAVLRAWEEFDQRPSGWHLDVWLMDVMDDCLDKLRSEPKRVPLSNRLLAEMAEERDGGRWSASAVTMEDLMPGEESSLAWDDLGRAEQQDRVDRLLGTMPGRRRDAFTQFILEGFDAAEIAMIQDRTEAEVKADIEAARQALKELLLGHAPSQADGHEAAAARDGADEPSGRPVEAAANG
ncbi:MAG TPA: sigma factor-like helix-turn-helix DNA-binding protein [Pirellulales bacterium]|nr:sigma factor-like helix-turn-helix DNA-binding protein [Pirellulales bacterium]